MNKEVIEMLNTQLANWNILNTKLHNYHWYVTGSDFFTLHGKFEEYYTEAQATIDEIAERILAIQGKPAATLSEYLNLASLQEATQRENAKEMVTNLISDYEQIINESDKLVDTAEEVNDKPTADMFIELITTLQQHVWMLKAYVS